MSVGVSTILALAASTIATMLFAELLKNYTIATPMKSALWLATPTIIFAKIFGPLVTHRILFQCDFEDFQD